MMPDRPRFIPVPQRDGYFFDCSTGEVVLGPLGPAYAYEPSSNAIQWLHGIGQPVVRKDVEIHATAKIIDLQERVCLGNAVRIDDGVVLTANMLVGDFVHIGAHASILGYPGKVTLGDFVGVSFGVRIMASNEDWKGASLTNPTVPAQFRHGVAAGVEIGKHVTVGANSVVMPGAVLAEGCGIGALSFVPAGFRSEPWTIYAGTPVRKVGVRDGPGTLELERQCRALCYWADGRYIPAYLRPEKSL